MADLSLLTSFVRTAEHGSFSAAARSLGVSAGGRQQERGAPRGRMSACGCSTAARGGWR
jgi:hypothetical protein